METKKYLVSKETNEIFNSFIIYLKEQNDLFKKKKLCDDLLKFFTKKYGNKIKLKMGSLLLYKSFNRNYFCKNLYKNMVALEYLSDINDFSASSISYTINDIGCGSAPSSIAYELLFNHKELMSFKLKDNSRHQIRIAKKMLKSRNILGANINVSSLATDDVINIKGLTFFSYFLCEQSEKRIKLLLQKINDTNGRFIFIDYDNKLDIVEKYLTGYLCIQRFKLCVELDDAIQQILKTETIKVNGIYVFKK